MTFATTGGVIQSDECAILLSLHLSPDQIRDYHPRGRSELRLPGCTSQCSEHATVPATWTLLTVGTDEVAMLDDNAETSSGSERAEHTASHAATAASSSSTATPQSPSLVDHLLADIHTLQTRGGELHQRLLDQMERRHAAEAALHAERFKVAALQRDLELVQLRLRSVNASFEKMLQERNDLERTLRDIRASLMWRVGKTYWSVTRKIAGRGHP